MLERRKSPRKKTRNLVLVSIPMEVQMLNLVDISAAGLQFYSPYPLPPYKVVGLKVNLSESNCHVGVIGRVIWSKATGRLYRIGVSFMDAHTESLSQLQQYLQPHQAA